MIITRMDAMNTRFEAGEEQKKLHRLFRRVTLLLFLRQSVEK